MSGFKGRLNDLYFNVTGVTLQKLNSFLLRRALVSTTELKYQRGLQSRLRNQVNPHGVQGWCRYVISLLKDLCTTLLVQSFHDGKETRKTSRRETELQTRRRLKTLKIPRKWFAALMAQSPKWGAEGSLVIPMFAYRKRHYVLRFAFR
jgi:hypothetical protein